jgi:acyl carrier protein
VVTVNYAVGAVIITSRDGRPVPGATYTFGIEVTAHQMSTTATMNDEERELAELIVTALNLEIPAADIQPEAPLYGEGLGLDSIDILEIALAVSKRYGVQIRSDDSENVQIFASLRSLSEHVQQQRPA